mgnify:CR=1 FL=1|jgi:hypothetical protein
MQPTGSPCFLMVSQTAVEISSRLVRSRVVACRRDIPRSSASFASLPRRNEKNPIFVSSSTVRHIPQTLRGGVCMENSCARLASPSKPMEAPGAPTLLRQPGCYPSECDLFSDPPLPRGADACSDVDQQSLAFPAFLTTSMLRLAIAPRDAAIAEGSFLSVTTAAAIS